MVKVLVPLVDGFEEIEAVSVIDVLRRAGADVVVAGLPGTIVTGSQGLRVHADARLDELSPEDFDAIVLPGGSPGYQNLMKSETVLEFVRRMAEKGRVLGAICGAPLVLEKAGVLKDRKATAYPGLEKELSRPWEGDVVVDGNVITSRGPGTAVKFAISLVEKLFGPERAMAVRSQILA